MHILCTAVIENEQQRKNLCDCIKILGGVPDVSFDTVSVDFSGARDTADKFAELFAQYPHHGICMLS